MTQVERTLQIEQRISLRRDYIGFGSSDKPFDVSYPSQFQPENLE
jgi:hypothetical protein